MVTKNTHTYVVKATIGVHFLLLVIWVERIFLEFNVKSIVGGAFVKPIKNAGNRPEKYSVLETFRTTSDDVI